MINTTEHQDIHGWRTFKVEGVSSSKGDLMDTIIYLTKKLASTKDTQAGLDLVDAQQKLKATQAKLANALMDQANRNVEIASRDAELSKLRKANAELVAELAKLRSKLGDLLYPNVLTASGTPVFTNDWSVCGIRACYNMQHEGGPYCLRHTPYRSDRGVK